MSGRRRRDSLLAALELVRARHRLPGLRSLILFLYVCENEGLNVSELASVSGLTVAAAARLVRGLAEAGAPEALPPAAGLVEFRPCPGDARVKLLHLTVAGDRLCRELDALLAEARPIRT